MSDPSKPISRLVSKITLQAGFIALLAGCPNQPKDFFISKPFTIRCHNSKDSEMWYTEYFFYERSVEVENNHGGWHFDDYTFELKGLVISESQIIVQYRVDESKSNSKNRYNDHKVVINRFTERYYEDVAYKRKDGSVDRFSWYGGCKELQTSRRF
jgi:hypothetical protein